LRVVCGAGSSRSRERENADAARGLAAPTREAGKVIENPYYSRELHGPYELFDLGDFVLEEGYTLRDCKLAYRTFGELNAAKDNAILVTTWYSGTHQTGTTFTSAPSTP
jgi:hypothetical protein